MGRGLLWFGWFWAGLGIYGVVSMLVASSPDGTTTGTGLAIIFAVLLFVFPGLAMAARGKGILQRDRDANRATKKCPACAESVLVDATRCRFCGESLVGAVASQ